ncbi:MAG: AAA family ATPase [Pseudomonadota bacterium]
MAFTGSAFGIAICNRKGGVGKTTLATNLASALAGAGHTTTLLDCDPQQSAKAWFERREEPPKHLTVEDASDAQRIVGPAAALKVKPHSAFVVYDSRPMSRNHMMSELLRRVRLVLVPLLPSPMDLAASADFIEELKRTPEYRDQRVQIGIVANRVRGAQLSSRALKERIEQWGLPRFVSLRDTQLYVYASAKGLGVAELRTARARAERETWERVAQSMARAAGYVSEPVRQDASPNEPVPLAAQ